MGRQPKSHVRIAVSTLFKMEKMERAVQPKVSILRKIKMNPLKGSGGISCYTNKGTVGLLQGRHGADRKRVIGGELTF